MKDVISIYNKKRSYFRDSAFNNLKERIDVNKNKIDLGVVIPIYNEYPTFLDTLNSFEIAFAEIKNTGFSAQLYLVINNRASDLIEVKKNNYELLNYLNNYKSKIAIVVLDYTTASNELPEKTGVGLARKIGMDYALLDGCKFISCMDADTIVEKNYFLSILKFIKNNKKNVALTFFKHQNVELQNDEQQNKEQQNAIDYYEDYLLEHSNKIKECGSPFWPVALGPTIICSAEAYCACGGMNEKLAGEDFYFLQSLIKNSIQKYHNFLEPIDFVDTVVHPSGRLSNRVLFGTGTKILDIMQNGKSICGYSDKCYDVLAKLINVMKDSLKKENPVEYLQNRVRQYLSEVYDFLLEEHFFDIWNKNVRIYKNNLIKLETSFYVFFDGLKIIRMFHRIMQ